MENKRKRIARMSKTDRKIAEIYEKGKCRDCCVVIEQMDFDSWFKKRRRVSNVDKEIEKIFEDKTNKNNLKVPGEAVVTDNRLRRNENGMVLLPRTFYNKHPAKQIVSSRRIGSVKADSTPKKSPLFSKNKKNTLKDKANGMNSLYSAENSKKEYQLVFINPVNDVTVRPPGKINLKTLSDMLSSETLPSKMWEIERIPPVLGFTENPDGSYDAIAAELEALMGDNKKNEATENMDVDMEKTTLEETGCKESPAKENHGVKDETTKSHSLELDEKNGSPIKDSEKIAEEFPSIMDILNEQPICESGDDKLLKEVSVESSKENTLNSAPEKARGDVPTDDSTAQIVPSEKCHEDKPSESSVEAVSRVQVVDNNDNVIKNVIFRRLTGDKQTYDRLVTFQYNLEYSVSINEKKVELLGAPEFITSIEDLQILLQIVDEVNFESFNVTYKS